MTQRFFIVCFILLLGLTGLGQDAQLNMGVSKNPVSMGERFKLTITLSGTDGSIVPPSFAGFTIHTGPIVSSQSSWGTGRGFSKTISHSYYLIPEKIGTVTIPPASAQTKAGKLLSKELKLEVVKSQAGNSAQRSGNPQGASGGQTQDCFVRMYTNKEKAVVGEPIVVTYWLYNRYPRFDLEQHEQLPQHSGFWKEDQLVQSPQWVKEYERVDGKDYQKAHLATQVLIPQRSGELALGQYEAKVAVGTRRSFFMNRMDLKSNLVKIDVNSLPNGKSDAFTGAVGNLSMNVELNKAEVDVNDAVELRVKLSGDGNLALINELELDLPEEFEVYDPKTKDRISTTAGGMTGSRTFEYLIIPRYPGSYELPPIEFQYYDLKSKKYISKESEALKLEVLGENGMVEEGGAKIVRKEDVSSLANDIRHIRTQDLELHPEGELFPASWKHFAGIGTPFFLLALFFVYRKRQESLDSDVSGSLKRRAGKVAAKHLKEARTFMDSGNEKEFYSALYQAMNDYASQKLSIPLAEVNKERLDRAMNESGLDATISSAWSRILSDCEMAAYAPSAASRPQELYEEVSQLIHSIEKAL